MRSRKLAVAATVLATGLAGMWASSANAGMCTLCVTDLEGRKHCFENMCAYLKYWHLIPTDAVKPPVDISSFVKELEAAVAEPMPQPWILISPASNRHFLIDPVKGTMTEIVGAQAAR